MSAPPLAGIMKEPSQLKRHGPSAQGEADHSVKGGKKLRGRAVTGRRGAAAKSSSPTPSPSRSESSTEPPAKKSRTVVPSSSTSSPAAAKGKGTKAYHPLPPKSPTTPSKKSSMQLGSEATPSTEVSKCIFCCANIFYSCVEA